MNRLAMMRQSNGLHSTAGKMSFVRVLLIALGMLAIGCTVDQDKEVAQYRAVLDGQKKAPPVNIKPGDPLSLEAALLLANRNSENLAISGEDYVQALIDKERAFSNFLPTVNFQPTLNWTNVHHLGGSSSTVISGSGFATALHQANYDVPLAARYNLFHSFADVANLRRAGYTADQRRALLLDLQQTVLLDVATTYYQILTNERSVEVLKNSVSVQEERVRDMEGRQRAGIARPLDVAQTQAQASSTRVQLIQAQNNVRNARQLIAFLTTAAVQDSPLIDRLLVPKDLMTPDQAVHMAQETRQDARAAEAAMEASRQNVQAAIAQWYPSVTLDLNYFLKRFTGGPIEWTGALQMSLPIFNGGQIHADVRTAWSQLRQAYLSQQQTRRQIAEQVQIAYENVIDSNRRIAELHVEVAAAAEALRQAESAYAAGLGTNLDRITAQDQLLSAQLSLASEEFNYKVVYLNLLRSMGRLPLPETLGPPPGTPTSRPTTAETQTPGPVRR
ncbi:MAG TPA: TolC family protein [Bryobacteraceae bacterium]|nr:TolC family protein [Bryobacteraceae bacterium]